MCRRGVAGGMIWVPFLHLLSSFRPFYSSRNSDLVQSQLPPSTHRELPCLLEGLGVPNPEHFVRAAAAHLHKVWGGM